MTQKEIKEKILEEISRQLSEFEFSKTYEGDVKLSATIKNLTEAYKNLKQ